MSHADHDLATLARDIAVQAGELALKARLAGVEVAASKSSLTDIVTVADQQNETFIRDAIRKARPQDGFLGEEGTHDTGTSGLTWVVDPIDGTVNYLYGLPTWAVSIAVVEGNPDPASWRAVAGAVVNPPVGEVFMAARGQGATLNGRALQVNRDVEIGQALVATGFGYRQDVREAQGEVLLRLIGQVRDIRRIGVAAIDLCHVAAGRVDAYYEQGLRPWDHAAGVLIAAEAGARVGGLDGAAAGQQLTLAADENLFRTLEIFLKTGLI